MTATELDAGPELDRLAALAMGWGEMQQGEGGTGLWDDGEFLRPFVPGLDGAIPRTPHRIFNPSRGWAALGEVIEKWRVHLAPVPRGAWTATVWLGCRAVTVTHQCPKVAACRCVVRAAGAQT
jgi:hypothetical protein